jgi:hypothetical protein
MKATLLLILLSIAVSIGAGMAGRERHRLVIEKRLMAAVESSGIIAADSDGIAVRFDHLTGIVTGMVNSEEEKATLLARLGEVVGAGRLEDRLVVPAPEPAPVVAPAAPPEPVLSPVFRLEKAGDLILVLAGTVPSEEVKSSFLGAAQRVAPELVTVEDRMRVDPAMSRPDWIAGTPDLIGRLVGSVQDPLLTIDGENAAIGGISDDRDALTSLGGEFSTLFAGFSKREDRLVHDASRPAPVTGLPLVFYMGPWEGKVLFEGSIPTAPQLKEIVSAASTAREAEKVVSRLRVSPQTVAEPWLSGLPGLVAALLESGGDATELVIVDGTIILTGEIPDKDKKKSILDLLEPIRSAGYKVVDELTVKP